MTLKHWKKHKVSTGWLEPKITAWFNDKLKITINIQASGYGDGVYEMLIENNKTEKIIKDINFDTKKQALTAAKKYMRTH